MLKFFMGLLGKSQKEFKLAHYNCAHRASKRETIYFKIISQALESLVSNQHTQGNDFYSHVPW